MPQSGHVLLSQRRPLVPAGRSTVKERISGFLAFMLFLLSISPGPVSDAAAGGFVRASGTGLMLDGQPFRFVGANCYYLMVYAADPGLRPYAAEVMEEAALLGCTVIRTWAFNDGASQWNALQREPGVYDETVFQALDWVVAKAESLQLKLILPLVNNWDDYGGMNQYVAWSPTANQHDEFYTDSDCREFYRNHLSTVFNRVNTITGRAYRDDPTILCWELANEFRCNWCAPALQAWIHEMASHCKSVDANHLVSTGEEGFHNRGTGPWWENGSQGTDFVANHLDANIDFATFHLWPENWGGWSLGQSMAWVNEHLALARDVIGKPVVAGEFGLHREVGGGTSMRDQLFAGVFDAIRTSSGSGSLFWILYHDAYPDYDGYGVYVPADTATVEVIRHAAGALSLVPEDEHGAPAVELMVLPNPAARSVRIVIRGAVPMQAGAWDVCGRPVRRLDVSRRSDAGSTIDWDLTDDHGSPLASGLYFLAIRSADARTVRRLVVLQ